jgi:hypothetical protein
MPSTNINGTVTTVVYYPPSSGNPHCILTNIGGNTAYVGQSGISSATGLPMPPNDRAKLLFAGGTIYATAGFGQIAPFGTANAVTSYPSGSTITVASGGTAFTSGMTVVIEPGTPRQEIGTVFSSNAGSVVTNAPFTYAHGTTTTFSQISPLATTVKAERGTA